SNFAQQNFQNNQMRMAQSQQQQQMRFMSSNVSNLNQNNVNQTNNISISQQQLQQGSQNQLTSGFPNLDIRQQNPRFATVSTQSSHSILQADAEKRKLIQQQL